MSSDVAIVLFTDPASDRAAQGLVGAGQRVAECLGGSLHAIALDPQQYQIEESLGAIADICRELSPRAVLLSNDTYSQEITPRLAHRLGGSAVGDGVAIDSELRVTRQVYGGKAQAVIRLTRAPAVVWLRARSFAPVILNGQEGEESGRRVTFHRPDPSPSAPLRMTSIMERRTESQSESRLEDARVIVSGGRGIGGAEGFQHELRPLASLLGAQVAASRAACDAGWVPPTLQVGQTGKKVAPDLYLAIGITGASQHMAGISDAKQIAAINIDRDAPIFKHCRFGIVEDYKKVVPLLREKLKALQT
ncbi:MAG TPA: electron transfer flavoprotein subunit alpha/FixB family protein [Thermoanaerobaculia bacterium]|nr:electron transfer flavoprotein subunit alpha/FixB family protein [Thermoanaerobaculia bacterium]